MNHSSHSNFYPAALQCVTSHYDDRPDPEDVSLLVIHNISLPPEQFGGKDIEAFFCGKLDKSRHPYFELIADMRVSAHCLIKRNGEVVQFVPFNHRAWHAGKSSFQGRSICNDYSIGIELEGADHIAYTNAQYASLLKLSHYIMALFPHITLARIVGHCDIAPLRKSDPGVAFDWPLFRQGLSAL
ncbi:MAG: 1,6-anhydro-N-acetylmuramyl-L-alanine amidase AmpD [Paraglaciecola sp.]|uniref:1,6-anhydro-N-acetylmuramyl-L-alanine amidase AmpD n=1 Tax=Paraglaciecola sp. TaxID=1920173 RepID=UPI00273D39E0|nr:1,6-anhydro-N-acetylmuramyl-L-alanine amidase AmpD [Paraglaciecola sp.]MDP5030327.1 1,6-anhydro-N-acetylmuramyl-L-alanine amidase AmpD [Paraglaciecola sp.]MDP5131506.1 1,6-anhydro-N-acetylmuramyl-L-alanine amidase AmpD [Paraglaciecola sp.]